MKIPGIVAFSLSFFFIKLTCAGVYYWYPTYLQEELHFSKSDALDIFSYFSVGSFFGNVLLGLTSDIIPLRSPIFELGIVLSTIFMFILAKGSEASAPSFEFFSLITAFLGATLFGSTIVIAAIECDMGNYVKQTYNVKALGTFSGVIDGFASLGSVLSQVVIAAVKEWSGWQGTFYCLTVITAMSFIPAI